MYGRQNNVERKNIEYQDIAQSGLTCSEGEVLVFSQRPELHTGKAEIYINKGKYLYDNRKANGMGYDSLQSCVY